MKSYYRVMLGKKSIHSSSCFSGDFIGADFEILQDLSNDLSDDWRTFNAKFIPIFLSNHPDKTKIGAGLACGALWTVSKGIRKGDIVLCPDGTGIYRVGEISGDYYYSPNEDILHRRPVHWFSVSISRADMSDSLKNSTGSIGTVSTITQYEPEHRKTNQWRINAYFDFD